MAVLSISFEHHAGDSTFWLGYTPIMRENTLDVVVGLATLLFSLASQEDLRLYGYLEYPMPQRHYTFTNIHVFSEIQTRALRRSSQRH
ncbi:hypothetical protein TNCV_4383671 [Trichonephila clavipes]|nr:hypothetical protein TNCV_4383671 [Trichonephila clavipes]